MDMYSRDKEQVASWLSGVLKNNDYDGMITDISKVLLALCKKAGYKVSIKIDFSKSGRKMDINQERSRLYVEK